MQTNEVQINKKLFDKQRGQILLLWCLCVAGISAPYGIIDEIHNAGDRKEYLLDQSPLHKLCDKCDRPATHRQSYTVSTRYFCDKHWPPPETVSFSPGDHGKGFSPWFGVILVLVIYIPNTFRAVVHFVSRGKQFDVTLPGAVTGIVFILIFWIIFFLKYRVFIIFIGLPFIFWMQDLKSLWVATTLSKGKCIGLIGDLGTIYSIF